MTIDEALDRCLATGVERPVKRLSVYETPLVYLNKGDPPWTASAGQIIGKGDTPGEAVEAALVAQAKVESGDWS